MRKVIALFLSTLLPLLGVAGVGQAQSAVQIEGTIQAVDCQAQTVVLSAPGGSTTVGAAGYTAVLIDSTSVPFCGLEGYIGAPAIAWLIASGDQFLATRIDVTGPVAVAPSPAPEAAVSPLPIVGIVLGTIVVAGLVYLLVHGPDGYYRYPYYGAYYRYYYHPQFRPYAGFYPTPAPIITVAPTITGIVLGIVVVNSLQYILARDAGGHLYRYPYYGPYHRYYYRPTYRTYTETAAYLNAPVRQGDPHWDAPAYTTSQANHAPATHNTPLPAVQRQPAPVYQQQPAVPRQPAPVYQQQPAAPRQPTPAYQQQPAAPRQPTPAYKNSGRDNTRGSPTSNQQCGGRKSDQSCSDEGSAQR